ncbi:chaperone protein dnaJ 11, chloroplastic-like [Vigna umbellata]|uniref:chaperone protein dnaJ 11, chloroplastic-like n=1 Tax=Vigna umbellata TaxID=87088 RepID=UPI001F5F2AB1|nr:chaperone protein dnaJ 11, chloroplastic-like [Vigna umbellata]
MHTKTNINHTFLFPIIPLLAKYPNAINPKSHTIRRTCHDSPISAQCHGGQGIHGDDRFPEAGEPLQVLRIKQNASAVEIKSAYRNLAKVYHPDSALRRSESDERDFIEIHDAYQTLSDPSARAVYDLSLTAARGGSGSFTSLVAPDGSSRLYYQTRKWENGSVLVEKINFF